MIVLTCIQPVDKHLVLQHTVSLSPLNIVAEQNVIELPPSEKKRSKPDRAIDHPD